MTELTTIVDLSTALEGTGISISLLDQRFQITVSDETIDPVDFRDSRTIGIAELKSGAILKTVKVPTKSLDDATRTFRDVIIEGLEKDGWLGLEA
ncbi:MAG: hypothetical protein WCT03_01635 [Candidatus Obscuribacterales bacterium]|jgi:hypothetical protein